MHTLCVCHNLRCPTRASPFIIAPLSATSRCSYSTSSPFRARPQVTDPQLAAVDKTDFATLQAAFQAGTCHVAELDAGKAYGFSLDPKILAKPLGIEGSGSYMTMAIAKSAKITTDSVTTFCDVVKNAAYKASHTGFMKSAGWISPMGATQKCIATVGTAAQKTACGDLTKTGEECHNAAYGNSCVPSMMNAAKVALTTNGASGNEICTACGSSSCADSTYSNYYGAALGLLKDAVDIAFVKEATMECPADGSFCKTKATAACFLASPKTCDSKSVYAMEDGTASGGAAGGNAEYAVAANTYRRVPGYGVQVPAHVIVTKGMTAEFKTVVGAKFAGASHTAGTGGSGAWIAGHTGKAFNDKTTDASVEKTIGSDFTAIMRDIPFFYKKNGLVRPAADNKASYEPASTSSATGTAAMATSAALVAATAAAILL